MNRHSGNVLSAKQRVERVVERSRTWVLERTLRERSLILVTSLVAVYALGTLAFIEPLEDELRQVVDQFELSTEKLAQVQNRAAEATRLMATGPDAALTRRAAHLEAEIAALEKRLEAHRGTLVSPEETVRVLQELVGSDTKLRLRHLETLSSKPVFVSPDRELTESSTSDPHDVAGILYRHDFAIEAEGTYFAALRYLRAIKALPWGVHVARFDYEVSDHPNAVLRLELYTLSFEEAWIGV